MKEITYGCEKFYLQYFLFTLFLYIVLEVIKTGVVALHQFFNVKCKEVVWFYHVIAYSFLRLPLTNGQLEIPSNTDE